MKQRRFLVTAALPYSNGRLHVGHIAGAYLPADIYVRYLRARGDDVCFICGTDDHGVTALIAARKEGVSVEELTAHYAARQAEDFKGLGIEFNIYGGTHQPGFYDLHKQISQDIFCTIHEKGYFKKKTTRQLYDSKAKQFLPDRYVKGKCYHKLADGTDCNYEEAYGDQCEACGNLIDPMLLIDPISTITNTRPEPRDTTHWYFRLDKFAEPLRRWIESKREPTDESPEWRRVVLNFSLKQIEAGLPERAMTRDLNWGVPVPLDDPDAEGKVLYVWFDAPIGYISFTAKLCELRGGQWQDYADWWKNPDCRILHFIGEDNIIFHALTWPAMLLAEGSYELPSNVVANSYLNIKFKGSEEQKISKSRGTAVWIEEYLKEFAPDPLRYYLTAIAPENQRAGFSMDDLITRNNGELVNALGNFVHRTMTFAVRYFDGNVPEAGCRMDIDHRQLRDIASQAAKVTTNLEAMKFKAALGELMELARASNRYFDAKKPWEQRKENIEFCGTTINVCLQTIRALAVLMEPFLPFSAEKCSQMLGLSEGDLGWNKHADELPAGHPLSEPVILFTPIETPKPE